MRGYYFFYIFFIGRFENFCYFLVICGNGIVYLDKERERERENGFIFYFFEKLELFICLNFSRDLFISY